MKRSRIRHHRKAPTVAGRANLARVLWEALVTNIQWRCDSRCENPLCRRRMAKLDPHHVQKRSQGGADALDNIVMLCRACHNNTDLPKQHMRWLGVEAHGREEFTFITHYTAESPPFEIAVDLVTSYMRYRRPQ